MKTKLDLSPLEKAISQLEKSLQYYHSDVSRKDHDLALQFMAASIQAFEYTYELCVKFLRRYLEMSEHSAENIDLMSFPSLVRTACERALIKNDWPVWKQFRNMRNITSHTYNELKAKEVMNIIPAFFEEAKYLLGKIKEKISNL